MLETLNGNFEDIRVPRGNWVITLDRHVQSCGQQVFSPGFWWGCTWFGIEKGTNREGRTLHYLTTYFLCKQFAGKRWDNYFPDPFYIYILKTKCVIIDHLLRGMLETASNKVLSDWPCNRRRCTTFFSCSMRGEGPGAKEGCRRGKGTYVKEAKWELGAHAQDKARSRPIDKRRPR